MKAPARFLTAAATFALVAMAVPASAEIVFLSSGRTLSVRAHRYDGESIVLTLRGGGEVTCDKSLIDKIVPDEVPYPEQAAAPVNTRREELTRPALDGPYAEIIEATAEAYGVDPFLVSALIKVESNFKPRARSRKGAMGLMQLMPATARQYGVRNAFDPRANIEAGIRHLRSLIDTFGVKTGLAAYNAGEGAVRKYNGIPPYRETRNYVARILALRGSQP